MRTLLTMFGLPVCLFGSNQHFGMISQDPKIRPNSKINSRKTFKSTKELLRNFERIIEKILKNRFIFYEINQDAFFGPVHLLMYCIM